MKKPSEKTQNPTINLFNAIIEELFDYVVKKNLQGYIKSDYKTKITISVSGGFFNSLKEDLKCLNENVDMSDVKYGGFSFSVSNYEEKRQAINDESDAGVLRLLQQHSVMRSCLSRLIEISNRNGLFDEYGHDGDERIDTWRSKELSTLLGDIQELLRHGA